MDPRLLRYPDSKLSPDARWLLLQWSRDPGLSAPLTCRRLELYRRFGMAHQRGRLALNELGRKGTLIEEPVRSRRGRPISHIHVSSNFQTRLEDLNTTQKVELRPEIESFCEGVVSARASRSDQSRGLTAGEEQLRKLAPATCWLLAVLLAHAKAPGIVTRLGLRDLMPLTGMTKGKLRSQLSTLKKLGVIATSESGNRKRRGAVFMYSVYVLDLTHPLFSGKNPLGLAAFFIPEGGTGRENFISSFFDAATLKARLVKHESHIVEKIESAFSPPVSKSISLESKLISKGKDYFLRSLADYHQSAQSLLPALELSETTAESLIEVHNLGMSPILKAHLSSYVMKLLTHHWNEVEQCDGAPHEPIASIMSTIQRDCYSLASPENRDKEKFLENDFFTLLYRLILHTARKLQLCLRKLDTENECDFPNASFMIAPPLPEQKTPYRVVKVFFRSTWQLNQLQQRNRVCLIPRVNLSLPAALKALPSEITRELN